MVMTPGDVEQRDPLAQELEAVMQETATVAAEYHELSDKAAERRDAMYALIRKARFHERSATLGQLAEVTGLTRARVHQITLRPAKTAAPDDVSI